MAAKPRLSPHDWLRAGLAALAREGAGALRAEALARELGTTKGSFYWHFADVPAYHVALLELWHAMADDRLPPADADMQPASALRDLARAMAAPDAIETAIRAWSVGDTAAASCLAGVDAARLDRITGLLRQIGVTNPDMARIIQAATVGLPADAPGDPIGTLVDLVLALR